MPSRSLLGINHQSPLIHFRRLLGFVIEAGNQSPIPFDTLVAARGRGRTGWESITNPL